MTRSIEKRLEIFSEVKPIIEYDGFINIGGGVASVGVGGIQKLRKNGFLSNESIQMMQLNSGVLSEFSTNGVPVIHVLRISNLIKDILPPAGEQLKIGEGILFFRERYNLLVASVAAFLSLGMVIAVGWYSKHQINVQLKSYEVESII